MDEEQAVAALAALKPHNPVTAHREADAILLTFLQAIGHPRVVEAYRELAKSKGHT